RKCTGLTDERQAAPRSTLVFERVRGRRLDPERQVSQLRGVGSDVAPGLGLRNAVHLPSRHPAGSPDPQRPHGDSRTPRASRAPAVTTRIVGSSLAELPERALVTAADVAKFVGCSARSILRTDIP